MATTLQTKEPTTTQALALPEDLRGAWGSEGTSTSDILIPRALLMQAMSEIVSDGGAKMGDIVRSTTGEIIGTKEKPVKIIPFFTTKNWVVSEKIGNRFEFRSIEPMTPENATAPLEWEEMGTIRRRDRELGYYVLLPQDIAKERAALDKLKNGEMPDPADALFPVHISFRRSSYNAGKVLATHFSTAARFNLPPATSTFHLSSEVVKNEQGQFATFTVKPAGKTSMDDLAVVKKWYTLLAAMRDKVILDSEVSVN